jgi:serine/threonine protein kinase
METDLRPTDPASVGKYRLTGRLGSGGMGEVFLGESPGGRLVAVKLIRADLAQRPDFRVRFAREVEAARRVGGIYTAPVVDADPDGEQPWLVTAYVDGPSLAETVEAQGPLPAEAVLRLAAGLAEGIAAIHAAGVVHRDLKPSNVLLPPDGPRIIDFGISRPVDDESLTSTGSIVGSPGFMSPEQADARTAGPPSDIFSLGSVLTFAATGEGPFGSGLPGVLLYRIVNLAPNYTGVPRELRPVVERCLAKEPADRPTAEQVLALVREAASSPPGEPADDGAPRTVNRPGGAAVAPAPSRPQRRDPPSAASPPPPGQQTPGYPAAPAYPAPPAYGYATPGLTPPPGYRGPEAYPAYQPPGGQRRPGAAWIGVAVAVVLLVAAGGIVFASGLLGHHSSGQPSAVKTPSVPALTHTPRAGPSPTKPAVTPASVVNAYIAAINDRDFARAWQLGGDNLGVPYDQYVNGFSNTASVVVESMRTSGDTVSVQTLATEKTGPVQTYALTYIIKNGIIVYGQQTLLSTNP